MGYARFHMSKSHFVFQNTNQALRTGMHQQGANP